MRNYASLEDAMQAIDHSTERMFRCHAHEDKQASASVNVVKGVWYCYACHARGKVDETYIKLDLDRVKEDVFALLDEEPARPLPESMLPLYSSPHPYWRQRFPEQVTEHFGFGSDPVTGQPTYPLRSPAGELLGMVRRSDTHPKYKYPTGVKAHELLFNYSPGIRDHVVLVEGAPDAAACWEAGVEAWGIFGSHLGTRQLELICKTSPKVVHLVFDNDGAGRNATEEASGVLTELGIGVIEFRWKAYPYYKDIAELELDKRRTALHSMIK